MRKRYGQQTAKRGKTMHLPHDLHALCAYIASVKRTTIPKVVLLACRPTIEAWARALAYEQVQGTYANGRTSSDGTNQAPPSHA